MKKLLIALLVVALSIPMLASTSSAEPDDTQLTLLHAIPGVSVDVLVQNEVIISNFEFGQSEDLSELAGETLSGLKVNLAGTQDTVIDAGDFPLPEIGNYTFTANLGADGNPTLDSFPNDDSPIESKDGRLVVRHIAAASALDVIVNGRVFATGVANGQGVEGDMERGTMSVQLVAPGTNGPAVVGPVDVVAGKRDTVIVYAVGSAEGGFQTLTQRIDRQPRPTVSAEVEAAARAAAERAVPGGEYKRVLFVGRQKSAYKVIMRKPGQKISVFLDANFNLVRTNVKNVGPTN